MTDLSIGKLNVMPKLDTKKELESAATEYTSIFFSQLLQGMFSGRETDPMFGGGHGEDVYKDMLITEYGKILAQDDKTGVEEALKRTLLKLQEV
jgi:flagellar protein FlgJ